MTPMIKRNCICIKTAEYILLIRKNLNVIQKTVYFLHLFQKVLLSAKSVNGEGIVALYAAPNPFLLNKICLNQK